MSTRLLILLCLGAALAHGQTCPGSVSPGNLITSSHINQIKDCAAARLLSDTGGGAHDLTTTDPSYPNYLTQGSSFKFGSAASPNTTRQPSILFSRRDSGAWTTGHRAISFNFRVQSGTGNKELFTIESRGVDAGNTGDQITFTSRYVADASLASTHSGFAMWLNADCFSTASDCGSGEANVINDSTADAASSYFGGSANRKYGLSIIAAAGGSSKKHTTALAIGAPAAAPFQVGIEIQQSSIDSGRPLLLAPNDRYISWRNAADTVILNILRANSSNDTELNTINDILFAVNGATKARIDANGYLGINVDPVTWFHVYADNSSTADMMRFEQDGTGDAAIQFLLTGTQAMSMGLDNANGDRFAISTAAGLAAAPALAINPDGSTQVFDRGTRPTCDSSRRGAFWFDAGAASVADTFEVCAKNSSDAYVWYALATIP